MNIEPYFPFFIILLIGLIRLWASRKKKDEREKRSQPSPLPKSSIPIKEKPSLVTPLQLQTKARKTPPSKLRSFEEKKDIHYSKTRKKKRIQSLVSGVGRKRKLILLAEILRTPKHF